MTHFARFLQRCSGIPALLVGCALLLTACKPASGTAASAGGNGSGSGSPVGETTVSAEPVTVEYDTDDTAFDWSASARTVITLNGISASVQGGGAAVSAGTVTITVSGVYEIIGTLADGSIVVETDKDTDKNTVFLILNNAFITSQTSAPLYVKSAKKVVILLADGTENTVYGGSGCAVNENQEPSAAVFSKDDLTITGGGKLTVKAEYNDGITSKDVLKITGGVLDITAKADGIVGKDSLTITEAAITVNAGKDGLRSTNDTDAGMGNVMIQSGTLNITAANDGIQAETLLQIDGGSLTVTTGGGYPGMCISTGNDGFGGQRGGGFKGFGQQMPTSQQTTDASAEESKKGIKATGRILLTGGTLQISSYDDAIHSNGEVLISGGSVSVQSGDDGIHADSTLQISGGDITVANSYEALEGANITLAGGAIRLTSSDDGVNVNSNGGVLTISGGEIHVIAGGDGLDSNGMIQMTGGDVTVDGPTNSGNGALDCDGTFTISGGVLIASGSSGMAEAPDANSAQASIQMTYSTAQAAGKAITLTDKDGNIVAAFTPSKTYNSVVISAPSLTVGETYTLNGDGTKIVEFQLSSTLTYLNESGVTSRPQGGMGGGGMGGGMGGGGMKPPR